MVVKLACIVRAMEYFSLPDKLLMPQIYVQSFHPEYLALSHLKYTLIKQVKKTINCSS